MKKVTALILALMLMISGTAAFAATFTHPETGENVTVDGAKAYIYDGRVYEEIAPDAELNGVKPDGKTDIATAMTAVAASLAEQLASGKIEAVAFAGIPAEVQTVLNALSIDQQMAVLLSILGCEVDISEDLVALVDSLDAETIAAIVAAFPKTTITVDGVSYEYFVIELKVTVSADVVEYERYGFRLTSDGEWVIERITVSEV